MSKKSSAEMELSVNNDLDDMNQNPEAWWGGGKECPTCGRSVKTFFKALLEKEVPEQQEDVIPNRRYGEVRLVLDKESNVQMIVLVPPDSQLNKGNALQKMWMQVVASSQNDITSHVLPDGNKLSFYTGNDPEAIAVINAVLQGDNKLDTTTAEQGIFPITFTGRSKASREIISFLNEIIDRENSAATIKGLLWQMKVMFNQIWDPAYALDTVGRKCRNISKALKL